MCCAGCACADTCFRPSFAARAAFGAGLRPDNRLSDPRCVALLLWHASCPHPSSAWHSAKWLAPPSPSHRVRPGSRDVCRCELPRWRRWARQSVKKSLAEARERRARIASIAAAATSASSCSLRLPACSPLISCVGGHAAVDVPASHLCSDRLSVSRRDFAPTPTHRGPASDRAPLWRTMQSARTLLRSRVKRKLFAPEMSCLALHSAPGRVLYLRAAPPRVALGSHLCRAWDCQKGHRTSLRASSFGVVLNSAYLHEERRFQQRGLAGHHHQSDGVALGVSEGSASHGAHLTEVSEEPA